MTDTIGALVGIIFILFLCAPIFIAVIVWRSGSIDVNDDGKRDNPYRWE